MARVIEERIISKIENWKDGVYSLSCRDRVEVKGNRADYFLWDSPIVTVYKETDGKITIEFSFCNWSSQTTKQRISEILFHFLHCFIFRKNWIHYLKMGNEYYKINESRLYTIKDNILLDKNGDKVEELKDFKY